MSDPIRAALDKAVAIDQAPTRHISPEKHVAEIIAAFLRALPIVLDRKFHLPNSWAGHPYPNFNALAQAVLAAAKDQAND
jgi:hypothetical protein